MRLQKNAPTDAPMHAPTKAPANMLSGSGSESESTHNADGSETTHNADGTETTHNADCSEAAVSDGGKTIQITAVDGAVTLTHANDDDTILTTAMNALTDVPMEASSIDGAPTNRTAAGVTSASHAGGDEYTASNDDQRGVSSGAVSGDDEITAEHVDGSQSDGVAIKYEIVCTGNEIKTSEVSRLLDLPTNVPTNLPTTSHPALMPHESPTAVPSVAPSFSPTKTTCKKPTRALASRCAV
jgi:hypothetical protein